MVRKRSGRDEARDAADDSGARVTRVLVAEVHEGHTTSRSKWVSRLISTHQNRGRHGVGLGGIGLARMHRATLGGAKGCRTENSAVGRYWVESGMTA